LTGAGGWSPALFFDIPAAWFGLLTWRKGPAPDVPAAEFTTVACTGGRGRRRLALARPLADAQLRGRVSELVLVAGGGTAQLSSAASRAVSAAPTAAARSRQTEAAVQMTLRQVTRLVPPKADATRQIHEAAWITNQMINALAAVGARYPGTDLILRYEVKSRPSPA
jgi:hypothetical protein